MFHIKNFPLRLQFVVVPITIVLTFGVLFYFIMHTSKARLGEIQNDISSEMFLSMKINSIHTTIANNHQKLFTLLASPDFADTNKTKNRTDRVLATIDNLNSAIRNKKFYDDLKITKREYNKLLLLFKEYKESVQNSILITKDAKLTNAFSYVNDVNSKFNNLNLEFFELYDDIRKNIKTKLYEKEKSLDNFNKSLFHDLIIVTMLIFLLTILVSNMLSRQIASLIAYMHDMTNETFHSQKEIPSIDRKDELGKMAQAIKHFKNNLMQLKSEIKKREQIEKHLRLTSTIFEKSNEGFIITDKNLDIIKANKAFEKISGYQENDLIGKSPAILKSGLYDEKFYQSMWHNLKNKNIGYWMGEVYNKHTDGSIYPVLLKIYTVKNEIGKILNYIGMFTDLSQIKRSQENIHYLSNYDFLTNIPNRNFFKKELNDKILTKREFVLVFLGLDKFKYINDSLGYAVGDNVLKIVAKRMRKEIHKKVFISRIRGDEFAMIFDCKYIKEDCKKLTTKIIDKILKSILEPMKIGNYELIINASAGMSMFPRDCDNSDDILKATNTALQKSKLNNKGSLTIYTKEMERDSKKRYLIDKSLQESVKLDHIECHFQPIIDAKTRKIAGFEALSRWNHKTLGFISPNLFIPIAEENGVIIKLTHKILYTSCKIVNYWNEKYNKKMFISVNFSPANLVQNNLLEMVSDVLKKTKLPPELLKIEITENLFLEHNDSLQKKLNSLREMKIHLSIDDFGTGYSSMQYLKRYPITNLKIDRSFIYNIPGDRYNSGICSAILNLAKGIEIDVIAEGVESKENADFLESNGCRYLQGFYFSKPLPFKKAQELVAND